METSLTVLFSVMQFAIYADHEGFIFRQFLQVTSDQRIFNWFMLGANTSHHEAPLLAPPAFLCVFSLAITAPFPL